MQVHKVELVIVDHDEVGVDEIKIILENARYPNHCISPRVLSIISADAGEWDDDHPLNSSATFIPTVNTLFNDEYGKLVSALRVVGPMTVYALDGDGIMGNSHGIEDNYVEKLESAVEIINNVIRGEQCN